MTEHHAAHLCLRVFEREIAMAGCRSHEIRDLAYYPHQRQVAFEQFLGQSIEFADADNTRELFRIRIRCRLHLAILASSYEDHAAKGRSKSFIQTIQWITPERD